MLAAPLCVDQRHCARQGISVDLAESNEIAFRLRAVETHTLRVRCAACLTASPPRWVHLVLTRHAHTLRVYIDGTLAARVAPCTIFAPCAPESLPLYLLRWSIHTIPGFREPCEIKRGIDTLLRSDFLL